jgi:hypothetical protein
MADTYPFLSPEWIAAAKQIYEEAGGEAAASAAMGAGAPAMKMNQVITDVPFGEGTIDAHIDSSSGSPSVDLGHIEGADVKITVPYSVAKAIFVEGNAAAGMQAFMSGQIKVEGDLSKLMAMQGAAPDATALEIQSRIKAITE